MSARSCFEIAGRPGWRRISSARKVQIPHSCQRLTVPLHQPSIPLPFLPHSLPAGPTTTGSRRRTMTAYLGFQPLLADGQFALRRQHSRGERRFGQKQIRQNRQPYRSNCLSRLQLPLPSFRKANRALIATQNVPRRSQIKFPYPSATQR